jgi:hypothetical protein
MAWHAQQQPANKAAHMPQWRWCRRARLHKPYVQPLSQGALHSNLGAAPCMLASDAAAT